MLTVWKYEIPMEDAFTLDLPAEAQLLTVQVQAPAGGVMLWALVDPETPTRLRHFRLAGTGHPIDEPRDQLRYVGSFQLDGGRLIFHLFETMLARSARGTETR